MARQIVLDGPGGTSHLRELPADDEAQLQEKLKAHPELLPIEEFGLEGPLMVIGRETSLPSGAADLVGMARGGDIVVVEFKTGPQNSDFRHTLAQLLDYGSDLWGQDAETFEASVARRYFTSDHCPADAPTKGLTSVGEAARATWTDMTEEQLSGLAQRWQRALETGGFHYVVAAQRFTATMQRTIGYLNDQSRAARFYAVELVRFAGHGFEAFEARTVAKPDTSRAFTTSDTTDEQQLLDRIPDQPYRQAAERLLDFCRGQDLTLEWGSAGVSMRLRVPGVAEPLSIGWLFPPGTSGWAGLRDLTLGHDTWRATRDIQDPEILNLYLRAVAALPGVKPVSTSSVNGFHVPPQTLSTHYDEVAEMIARLVEQVAEIA